MWLKKVSREAEEARTRKFLESFGELREFYKRDCFSTSVFISVSPASSENILRSRHISSSNMINQRTEENAEKEEKRICMKF